MKHSSSPTISVVIPCRNERTHIGSCISSLLEQVPVPGGFEVIVAEGMSGDGTREILNELSSTDHRITVVDNPQQTTACGMNRGIREARGRFIAIMGAHNRYARDYLHASLEVLQQTGADNVGGSMICEAKSELQQAIAAAHHSGFAVGGARWHDPHYEGPADTVFGGVYRREVFDRIGLFDETLIRNQDDELNLRLTRAGGKIWQSPKIVSWYSPRKSLSSLFRQYLQYGFWKVKVIRKHRLPASWRHLVPAAFILANIALMITAILTSSMGSQLSWRWSLSAWLGLLALYSAASLGAAFVSARRRSWRLLPMLPLVFAIFHFAYGFGFLAALATWPFERTIGSDQLFTATNH
jgi:succinoglycan biosynthesis protein ExoA